jgi:hypothetical protein
MKEAPMPAIKITKPYPFVYKDIDRQGEVRWRLRMRGRKTVTIKGVFGSAEFASNYRAAIEGNPAPAPNATKHGTMAAIARSYLHSAAFAALAKTTQRVQRNTIEHLIEIFGNASVAGLERRHVMAILDGCAGMPGEGAQYTVGVASINPSRHR